jgi:dUTP pyrophosphatase
LPSYAHDGDAGLDLYSATDVTLAPFHRALVSTGVAVAIPEGHAGFVLPRSGLAARDGLSLVNAPGLIDSHYRGEVKVVAVNLDPEVPIEIRRGDRIAQLVVQAVAWAEPAEVAELDATARGEGGFGSTGS